MKPQYEFIKMLRMGKGSRGVRPRQNILIDVGTEEEFGDIKVSWSWPIDLVHNVF